VFSNEARGPSDAILALADELATIPGAGRAESLSVAIAASVMMAALS
jgi:tRNA G18 (ribose-2'-O)-methylase SpoU